MFSGEKLYHFPFAGARASRGILQLLQKEKELDSYEF